MTEHRPSELADGIWVFPVRTPTLPPATHTNAYLVGRDEFVVIEPASPEPIEQDALASAVLERLEKGQICRAAIPTHHHPDHVGGLAAMKRRFALPIWGHRETARLLGADFERFIEDGEAIELNAGPKLQALHTPGHAPGHLCFWSSEQGIGIVGDMLAGTGTILIDPEDGSMAQYLASLRRLQSLSPSLLLPAHGPPIEDPQPRLEHYIRHRLARESSILEALRSFPQGAALFELLPIAYADTPTPLHGIAARSLESHLLKLIEEEKVRLLDAGRYLLAL